MGTHKEYACQVFLFGIERMELGSSVIVENTCHFEDQVHHGSGQLES
jgi:hypothetical protein